MKGMMVLFRICALGIIVFTGHKVSAQDFTDDIDLASANIVEKPMYDDYNPPYMFKNSKAIVKYSPPALAFGALMYGYQALLSVQISSSCMYSLSCSRFSVSAIREYGLIKGILLSADRLCRCNQIAGLDVHPLRISREDGHVHDSLESYTKKK